MNVPTALCSNFLCCGPWHPQSKEKMVLKSSTKRCELSFALFVFFFSWILNFTFRALPSPVFWKLPSFDGRLVVSAYFFTFFLPRQTKAKWICLWQQCWRCTSFIGKRLAKFLLELSVKFSEFSCSVKMADRLHVDVKISNAVSFCFQLQLNSRNTSYKVSENSSPHFELVSWWKSCRKYQNFEPSSVALSGRLFSLVVHMCALRSQSGNVVLHFHSFTSFFC